MKHFKVQKQRGQSRRNLSQVPALEFEAQQVVVI
jgi:hypothetical protein